MNVQVMERLTIEHHLRSALENKEFFLVYQPQINLSTSRICGMEALIHWNQPQIGAIPPDRFIRVAENSGLILPIGEWVLQTACSTVKRWHDQGLPRIPVAVSVSAIQFRQECFCEVVRKVLRESGLPPECLELEVTETALLSGSDVTRPVLQELNRMGVKLAIDDFGTGYSSLSYLHSLPLNKVKIDRSFLEGLAAGDRSLVLLRGIARLSAQLGLSVTVEGIETAEQLALVSAEDTVEEVQGFLFSPAIPFREITRLLQTVPTKLEKVA